MRQITVYNPMDSFPTKDEKSPGFTITHLILRFFKLRAGQELPRHFPELRVKVSLAIMEGTGGIP